MGRTIFLSFLGKGRYETANYTLDGMRATATRFVQRAMVELLSADAGAQPIDEIHVFTTPEAKEHSWEGYGGDASSGLRHELEAWARGATYPAAVAAVDIPHPSNVDSAWDTFSILYDVLKKAVDESDDDSINVIFDITHSFRHLPMLTLLVLHFSKVVLDINVHGIFYGEYREGEESPIVDLGSFSVLQDWITRTEMFLHGGNARPLAELTQEQHIAAKQRRDSGVGHYRRVEEIVAGWSDLLSDIQVSRAKKIQPLARQSVERIDSFMEQKDEEEQVPRSLRPVTVLLNRVRAELSPMAVNDELSSGVAAVEWCMRQGLVQQAYTLARELIVTLLCIRFDLSFTNRDSREKAERHINTVAGKYRKNHGAHTAKPGGHREDAAKGAPLSGDILDFLAEKEELLKLWDTIAAMRNDVNHAGWLENPARGSTLAKRLDVPMLRGVLMQAFGDVGSPVVR